MNLYIDIETVPAQNQAIRDKIATDVVHPGNISKPETIDKWYAEKYDAAVDDKWRETSFHGTVGEIISIAWAIDDKPVQGKIRALEDSEATLLDSCLTDINKALPEMSRRPMVTWVGHYITGFDLRFIWQRCVINNIKPPLSIPYDVAPWKDNVFDTKTQWSGNSARGSYSKLDDVMRAFGYPGKGDIDGSKVWDYIQAGRYDEVLAYNKQDVEDVRIAHNRMTFAGAAS